MIVYKIDKQSQVKVNSQIRDLSEVLSEIPNTLEVLADLMSEHSDSMSTPSISNFRADLQRSIVDAINMTAKISSEAQRLAVVSEQAGKHLNAIEEHFGASLRNAGNQQESPQTVS